MSLDDIFNEIDKEEAKAWDKKARSVHRSPSPVDDEERKKEQELQASVAKRYASKQSRYDPSLDNRGAYFPPEKKPIYTGDLKTTDVGSLVRLFNQYVSIQRPPLTHFEEIDREASALQRQKGFPTTSMVTSILDKLHRKKYLLQDLREVAAAVPKLGTYARELKDVEEKIDRLLSDHQTNYIRARYNIS